MSTTLDENYTTSEHSPSSAVQMRASKKPVPKVFKPWPVCRLIDESLGGIAQFLAIQLARRTPVNGAIAITHEALAEITKLPVRTIRRVMPEVIKSGLITGKRTNVGYLYTWTEQAYNIPLQTLGRNSHSRTTGDEGAQESQLVRDVVEKAYCAKRLGRGIPVLTSWREIQAVPLAHYERICAEVVDLAKILQTDGQLLQYCLPEAAKAIFDEWFKWPGKNNWLNDNKHPLWSLQRDLSEVVGNIVKSLERKAAAVANEARVYQHEPSAQQKAQIAQQGRAILSTLAGPSTSAPSMSPPSSRNFGVSAAIEKAAAAHNKLQQPAKVA